MSPEEGRSAVSPRAAQHRQTWGLAQPGGPLPVGWGPGARLPHRLLRRGAPRTRAALPFPGCLHGAKAVATRQLWRESIHFAPAEQHDMDCKIWLKGF